MKKNIYLLLLFFTPAYSLNNIELFLDLGGSKFQYLENVFVKVVFKNNSSNPIEIGKRAGTGGPIVDFILVDEQLRSYPNTMADDYDWGQGHKKKYYKISPNTQVEFPQGSFYNIQYYMPGIEGIVYPLLEPGKYRIKGAIRVQGTTIESEWVEFEILPVQYFGIEEFRNVKIEYGMGAEELKKNCKIIEKKYWQILDSFPTTIMTLRVILNLAYLYEFYFPNSESKYVYSRYLSLLKRVKEIQKNKYPDSRFAYFVLNQVVVALHVNNMEKFSFNYKDFYDDFYSEVTNPDLKKISQLRKNNFKQPGVELICKDF